MSYFYLAQIPILNLPHKVIIHSCTSTLQPVETLDMLGVIISLVLVDHFTITLCSCLLTHTMKLTHNLYDPQEYSPD